MATDEQWDIASGIGITALGVAAARAIESTRPDRLIEDPYAAAFLAAVPSPVPADVHWPRDDRPVSDPEAILLHSSLYIGVRSRYFDEYLRAASADGVAQVVILAAGLDSRAYRLDWPAGLRLYEIDQPKVLEFKETVLHGLAARPRCHRPAGPGGAGRPAG